MFRRQSFHPIIMVIIALAGIGFATNLIFNPAGLLRNIFFTALFVGGFFLVYKFITEKKSNTGQTPGYKRALQQSKKRHGKPVVAKANNMTPIKGLVDKTKQGVQKKRLRSVQKSNKEHNFTVIEGRKGKKKNRAFF